MKDDPDAELIARLRAVPYSPAREAAREAADRLEALLAELRAAREGLVQVYGLIDQDQEVKAMKVIRNIADAIDKTLGGGEDDAA